MLMLDSIEVILKPVDENFYVAILEELKEKEYYNMVIDIQNKEKMIAFLKAVWDIYEIRLQL